MPERHPTDSQFEQFGRGTAAGCGTLAALGFFEDYLALRCAHRYDFLETWGSVLESVLICIIPGAAAGAVGLRQELQVGLPSMARSYLRWSRRYA